MKEKPIKDLKSDISGNRLSISDPYDDGMIFKNRDKNLFVLRRNKCHAG